MIKQVKKSGTITKRLSKDKYDPSVIEPKWQSKWELEKTYQPDINAAKKPYYALMMFPYPSAEGLHVGNVYTFTGADSYARFKRMQGHDVFEPIGLDGFGIHSENYSLKIGSHPMKQSKISEENFYKQLHSTGNSFDWSRTVETYDPAYYKWTQWVFTELFKAGLAYRKKAEVNFCPSCKTVLADEQVIDEKCERCSNIVERRDLEQWFFRITEYAEQLLHNLENLDWSEKIKIAQRNWIGKSHGLLFTAPVKNTNLTIETFSAHFEACYADTFVVIAPDHPFLKQLLEGVKNREQIIDFCKKIIVNREKQRKGEEIDPEGIFTGRYIVDPLGNGDLPIWVASYALADYGTGIIKCSAHDKRDFAFAKKYGISLKPVLFPDDQKERQEVKNLSICYTDMKNGYLSEPSEFSEKKAGEVREEIISFLERKGLAKQKTNYHLRDWLISRQRYWGPPIPMIYCQACSEKGQGWLSDHGKEVNDWEASGWYPEQHLPVELPYVKNYKPLGSGRSPLYYSGFYETTCPNCGGAAKREADVSDTFLDSAWYFFRYLSTDIENRAFDIERTKKWLPVTIYIGGAEHAVLHLLYARFITMVFKDLGYIDFAEPFSKFYAHGLIIKDGSKMSKSKGNVVIPDVYIKKYGADTLRTYLRFIGPFNEGGDFRDSGIDGMNRFIKRIWTLFTGQTFPSTRLTPSAKSFVNKTIKAITEDMENLRFNTVIAHLMTYYNFFTKVEAMNMESAIIFLQLLAPFAPHIAEELWSRLGKPYSIHTSSWPTYDDSLLEEQTKVIVFQVNGKVRDAIEIATEQITKEKIEKLAKESTKLQRYLKGKTIKTVIYVPGKVINFVIG